MDLSAFLSKLNLDGFTQKEKSVIIGLAIALLILILGIGIVFTSLIFRSFTPKQALVFNPTSTPRVQNLPLVSAQEPTATLTPSPTQAPAATPKPLKNVWIVMAIEDGGYKENGLFSDLATFANQDNSTVTIMAYCTDPGWPTPEIGKAYSLNSDGLLSPNENNPTNNLQRFKKIE